jgi:hypothetical protein
MTLSVRHRTNQRPVMYTPGLVSCWTANTCLPLAACIYLRPTVRVRAGVTRESGGQMDVSFEMVSGDRPLARGPLGEAHTLGDLLGNQLVQSIVQRGVVEAQWRSGLRVMCEEARAERVPAERFLGDVRQALGILCERCGVPEGRARVEFTKRIETLCLEEYYAGLDDEAAEPSSPSPHD